MTVPLPEDTRGSMDATKPFVTPLQSNFILLTVALNQLGVFLPQSDIGR